MKTSKKLLSLLLVLAMVFALGCTAYASEAPADGAGAAESTEEPAASEAPATTPAPEGEEETPAPVPGKIVILHTNDVHGAIDGYAKIAALKAEYEADGAAVLLVDAGDFSQGTVEVSSSKGATAVELMNLAGYDFAAPGNHEFDYGYAGLVSNMKSAEFEVLAANLTYNGKAPFAANATVELGGKTIGIFGLTTPETAVKANPAMIVGVKFLAGDALVACAREQVAALEAAGCDYIVCLGHLGIDEESTGNRSVDLLTKVTGIDVFIDGHSHSTLEEVMAATGNTGKVGDTYLTSTGTAAATVGVVTIENGTITVSSVDLESYTGSDAAVAARTAEIQAEIDAEYGAVFAKTEVDLNGERAPGNRTEETNLGDLIADAILWYALDQADLDVDDDHVVAVTNGGGIRASIAAGDITKADVNTVLPFGNTVAYIYVTGAQLLEALEAATYCTPEAVGAFPQVAGIEFSINTEVAYDKGEAYPGDTYYGPASIKRVSITSVNGKAFDPEATYCVVSNDFTAAGGDTYYAFTAAENVVDSGYAMDVVVMDYITEVLDGVVTAEKYGEPAGRITVVKPVFTDVAADAWYYEPIMTAYNEGLMTGVSATEFAPNTSMTRAMIVTMLYRLAGEPAVEGSVSETFGDCADGQWYSSAVLWASANGIVTGRTADTFDPNATLTRQELATILYRYETAGAEETEPAEGEEEATAPELTFADADEVASWALEGVAYCVENSLMSGVSATEFAPAGSANRAMGATVLVRLNAAEAA